jgi:uncharacterized caspase-like protein
MLQDHALIVGINHYVGFRPLPGASNDAVEFRKWVRSMGVNDDNIHFPISKRDPPQPLKQTVEDIIFRFINEFRENNVRGRRLYLFFSGHGVEPNDFTEGNILVLMADAAKHMLGRNVPVVRAARLFNHCSIFDEVILFADCCRTIANRVTPWFDFETELDDLKRKGNGGKILIGLATRWSYEAREEQLPDASGAGRVWRGVFSYALLEALAGAEDPDKPGYVTGRSLKQYIERRFPQQKYGGDVPKIDGDLEMVVAPVRNPVVSVNVTLGNPSQSFEVRHGAELNRRLEVDVLQVSANQFEMRLPRGIYWFGRPGTDADDEGCKVNVEGNGPIDVQL